MNIEQNSNMQELTEEEYTKVYAGMMSYELFPENNVMTIQPFNPSKPKKNTLKVPNPPFELIRGFICLHY